MNKFLLIDASHLFHRSIHVVRGTPEEKCGMCLHILFSSLGKAWKKQNATHVVFAWDGRSWRKDVYAPYKRNRADLHKNDTAADKELTEMLFTVLDNFRTFISEQTNCTTLSHPELEADDLIAGWVAAHPNDQHIIVSGDKDFEQLLAPNVTIYDGVADETITLDGVYNYQGNKVKDKKTGQSKSPPNPEWSIFEKCMRGCTSDNIFAAYPGARVKSSKKQVGLQEAYDDRIKQGFAWSSVMMHRWMDPAGEEHRVIDDYHRNRGLVDLTAQPNDIKEKIAETIADACTAKNKLQVGIFFLKFCGKYQLERLSQQPAGYAELLSAKYPLVEKMNYC